MSPSFTWQPNSFFWPDNPLLVLTVKLSRKSTDVPALWRDDWAVPTCQTIGRLSLRVTIQNFFPIWRPHPSFWSTDWPPSLLSAQRLTCFDLKICHTSPNLATSSSFSNSSTVARVDWCPRPFHSTIWLPRHPLLVFWPEWTRLHALKQFDPWLPHQVAHQSSVVEFANIIATLHNGESRNPQSSHLDQVLLFCRLYHYLLLWLSLSKILFLIFSAGMQAMQEDKINPPNLLKIWILLLMARNTLMRIKVPRNLGHISNILTG